MKNKNKNYELKDFSLCSDNNQVGPCFNQYSSFMKGLSVQHNAQKLFNEQYLANNSKFILEKSKKFGYTPQMHEEKTLKELIVKNGFGKHLDQLQQIKQSEFSESVRLCLNNRNKNKISPPNLHELHKAVQLAIKICRFPKRKFRTCSTKFALTTLRRSASAGFGYNGRKGLNLDEIGSYTDILFDPSKSSQIQPLIHQLPQVLSFRLQQRTVSDQIKRKKQKTDVKVRSIFMYPGHITNAETRFGFPFLCHFQNLGLNSFYASGFNGKGIGDLLKHRLASGKFKQISLDVSAWDQNLPNWLVYSAFYILRSQLQLTKHESIIFNNIVTYFSSNIVSTKIGKIHELHTVDSGLSSGSLFTNMVGTLCHLVLLCLIDPNIVEKGNFILCSDDNIFSSTKDLSFYTQKYKQIAGLEIQKQKSDLFPNKSTLSFLGYTWINYKRHINIELALNQIVFHASFRTDLTLYDREVARSASVLLNGWNGIPVFKKLFPEIISAINKGHDPKFIYLRNFMTPLELLSNSNQNDKSESLALHLSQGPLIR